MNLEQADGSNFYEGVYDDDNDDDNDERNSIGKLRWYY